MQFSGNLSRNGIARQITEKIAHFTEQGLNAELCLKYWFRVLLIGRDLVF